MAYNSSERLTLLINDLLDLQKVDAGRMEFVNSLQSIESLLQESLKANLVFSKMLKVELVLREPIPSAFVNVDPNRWQQVMANLISNACKYSPPQGCVELSAELIEHSHIRIEIRDHGEGIPNEFKNRIFQRFAQADSSDTKEQKGTGLGLSIAKTFIETMHGSIGYRSELGLGSTFYIDLPVAES